MADELHHIERIGDTEANITANLDNLQIAIGTDTNYFYYRDNNGTLHTLYGLSGYTTGSVLFAGATGILAEDNANFFWDDTNNGLCLGTTTYLARLTIAGNINFTNSGSWTIEVASSAVDGRDLAIAAGDCSGGTLTGGTLFLQAGNGDTKGDISISTATKMSITGVPIWAGDASGLLLLDDAGNYGIDITDGGWTGIKMAAVTNVGLSVGGDLHMIDNAGDPILVIGDAFSAGNYGYIQWNSAGDILRLGTEAGGDAVHITEANLIILEASADTSIDILHLTTTNSALERLKFSLDGNGGGNVSLLDGVDTLNTFFTGTGLTTNYLKDGYFAIGTDTRVGSSWLTIEGAAIVSNAYITCQDSSQVDQFVVSSDASGNTVLGVCDTSGNTDVSLNTGADSYFNTGHGLVIGGTSTSHTFEVVGYSKLGGAEGLKFWTYTHTITAGEAGANQSDITITAVTLAKIRLVKACIYDSGTPLVDSTEDEGNSTLSKWSHCSITATTTVSVFHNGAENQIINLTIIEAA